MIVEISLDFIKRFSRWSERDWFPTFGVIFKKSSPKCRIIVGQIECQSREDGSGYSASKRSSL